MQQQPMYYPTREGGAAKTAAIILGILCGALFIGLLAVTVQLMDKSDELASKVATINEKNQEIDELKLGVMRKKEIESAAHVTGADGGPVDKDWRRWYDRCKELEGELAAMVEQAQFYKDLVPTDILEKNEDVFVKEADLKIGSDSMYLTMTLVNKGNTSLNNVTGKVSFFNDNLIVKEIPFTAPLLEPSSETKFQLPPIPLIDQSHYRIQLTAGNRPYDRH